ALIIHTLLDALIVIIPGVFGGGVLVTEMVVAVFAVVFLIWMYKKAWKLFNDSMLSGGTLE
ncbi:MAG: hypothetical protein RR614_01275, partial [Eubacterium sp.]